MDIVSKMRERRNRAVPTPKPVRSRRFAIRPTMLVVLVAVTITTISVIAVWVLRRLQAASDLEALRKKIATGDDSAIRALAQQGNTPAGNFAQSFLEQKRFSEWSPEPPAAAEVAPTTAEAPNDEVISNNDGDDAQMN